MLKRIFKTSAIVLITFIAILVIGIGIGYLFLAKMPNNGKIFSSLATRLLNKPVVIQSASINAFSLYPAITFHHVTFTPESSSAPKVYLESLKITLDLQKSLHDKKWISDKIIFSHLKLHIDHVAQNNYRVLGLSSQTISTEQNSQLLSNIGAWITAQNSIQLQDANIEFCQSATACYAITHLNFTIDNKKTSKTQSSTVSGFGSAKLNDINLTNLHANITDFNNPQLLLEGDAEMNSRSNFRGVLHFIVEANNKLIRIFVKNRFITGSALINTQKKAPIQIRLRYLSLKMNKGSNKSQITLDPLSIPSLNILIDNLFVNNAPYGRIKAIAKTRVNGISITALSVQSPLILLTAHGTFTKQGKNTETALRGKISSPNLGDLLKQRQFTSRLIGGKYETHFSLRWPNALHTFRLRNASGKMDINLENATILNSQSEKSKQESAFSFSNILDLISLQTISKLLTFDLIHSEKNKGFMFYSLKGNINLKNGTLTTNDVELRSPVAKINFSGNINLQNKRQNVMMHVSPYFAAKKPTLSGFPIGTLFWVAKKTISPIVNPFIKRDYHVTGTLDKPVAKRVD